MKGEYFIFEESPEVNGKVVAVLTSEKKVKEYIKSRAVQVDEGGFSGTLENGGFIGAII
jgi:hypothetical protein